MNSGRFNARFGNFDTLIFLHIPKTAGTTLRPIIERQYRRSVILRAYNSGEGAKGREFFVALPIERIKRVGLVVGHIEFGWHALMPQKAIYLTMLREPIDRVVSQYYHIRGHTSHRLHNAVKGGAVDIEEYVRRGLNPDASNGETHWLSGGLESDTHSGLPEEALQKAKDNIEEYFPVIGIQERFDESLILFKRAFRWKWVYYSRRNVADSRASLTTLPDRVVRTIREFNQLDIDLYEYAQRKFEDLVLNEGITFRREVARFQLMNRNFGKLVSPVLDLDPRQMIRNANSEVRALVRTHRSI